TIRLPARATDIASANLLLAGEAPRHARGPASAPMKILLLSNPVSGGGHAAAMAGRLAERLVSAGHEVCSEPTRLEPPETWLDALAADAELLVAVGGDGTVRLVAPSAARIGVPVTHFPAGTE